jgi:hypothetical protein
MLTSQPYLGGNAQLYQADHSSRVLGICWAIEPSVIQERLLQGTSVLLVFLCSAEGATRPSDYLCQFLVMDGARFG